MPYFTFEKSLLVLFKILVMRYVILLIACLSMQINQAQIKKKDLDEVNYVETDDGEGGVIYGFSMNGKLVGPNYHIKSNGMRIYTYFDDEGVAQGVQILTDNSGMMLLAQMRDGKMHGNAFKMTGDQLNWAREYKKGEIKSDESQDYKNKLRKMANCIGNCMGGFGMKSTSEKNFVIGFFHSGGLDAPAVYFYDKDRYMGEMKKKTYMRDGFGTYKFSSGNSLYMGMWKKNERHGLGIWFNEDGSIYKKGYFKNDKLIVNK